MIPSVLDVFARSRNKVVEDILARVAKQLEHVKIDLEHVNEFTVTVPTGIERDLSHGERLAIKLALGEQGWGVSFTLKTLRDEILTVYVNQS